MKRKEIQQVNLNSETRDLLKQMADDAGLSISVYVERLIIAQSLRENQLNLSKEVRDLIKERAKAENISTSTYLERLLLVNTND